MNALLSFCLCFTVMADIVCLTNVRVAGAALAAAFILSTCQAADI